jgi:arginine repressor
MKEVEESQNLMQGLLDEIIRVKDIVTVYKSLPKNAGLFASVIMETLIKEAIKSISDGDTIAMIRTYKELKECE